MYTCQPIHYSRWAGGARDTACRLARGMAGRCRRGDLVSRLVRVAAGRGRRRLAGWDVPSGCSGSSRSCAYRIWRWGQDPCENHPTGTPAAWWVTQGPGEGFQRMDGGQQRARLPNRWAKSSVWVVGARGLPVRGPKPSRQQRYISLRRRCASSARFHPPTGAKFGADDRAGMGPGSG
jgi:hypothetical protein